MLFNIFRPRLTAGNGNSGGTSRKAPGPQGHRDLLPRRRLGCRFARSCAMGRTLEDSKQYANPRHKVFLPVNENRTVVPHINYVFVT